MTEKIIINNNDNNNNVRYDVFSLAQSKYFIKYSFYFVTFIGFRYIDINYMGRNFNSKWKTCVQCTFIHINSIFQLNERFTSQIMHWYLAYKYIQCSPLESILMHVFVVPAQLPTRKNKEERNKCKNALENKIHSLILFTFDRYFLTMRAPQKPKQIK